jgi:large subunit ribosomal protein L21
MLRWRTARKGEKVTVYAVVETGGKQVRVEPGQVVEVDRLPVEAGAEIPLGRVLLVVDGDRVVCGTPEVPGARVVAKVVAQVRARKLRVWKYKPKKHYRRHAGHRQPLTRVRVDRIEVEGMTDGAQEGRE